MGLTKNGDIIWRVKYSRCEVCKNYISEYKCKFEDYINVMCWNGFDSHKCDKFESSINNHSSQFIFRDYESIPIREFGKGLYRFDKMGNKI